MTPRPPVLARYFVPLLVTGALSLLLGGAIALGFAPAATAMVLGAREEAAAVLLCVGAAGTALGIYGASVVAPAYQARCAEACDQKAKAYLAAVRREDLSVSASFSRGEAVTKAPGVIAGGGRPQRLSNKGALGITSGPATSGQATARTTSTASLPRCLSRRRPIALHLDISRAGRSLALRSAAPSVPHPAVPATGSPSADVTAALATKAQTPA